MKWVAFLRAINVGGHRVTGDQLIAVFERLGHGDVSTFLASGNVIFSGADPALELIEAALADSLGYAVPVILRSQREVDRIAAAEPFTPAELTETSGNVQVLLRRARTSVASLMGDLEVPPDDILRVDRDEVFWLPRAGISDSKLKVQALERQLGTFTVRTVRTLERLSARL